MFLSKPYTNSAPNESASFARKKKWDPVQIYLRSVDWKQRIWGIFGLLSSGGVVFLAGDLLYAWWVNQSNERRVNKTMEKGTRPHLAVLEAEYVPRPEVIERLKEIFQPNKYHSHYHAVCGEHGTGKTTLTMMVANEVGKGVIYIDIPSNLNNLGDEFGKAINFIFEEDASFTMQLKRKIFYETN
ncbi:3478_t:CDS:1, partial [Acaulospora morrowiae]